MPTPFSLKLSLAGALLLSLVLACSASRNPHNDADSLPGWLGSDHKPPTPYGSPDAPPCRNLKVLDAEARIFLCKKFLSDEEADHIKNLAEMHMARSGVVDASSGGSKLSEIRTSSGTFLNRGQDDVIAAVEERIARWSLLPANHGEGLQVLRYEHDQKYDAHWDYFFHAEGTANGGNRYATVLMYLMDTEEGGETVFPNIPAPGGENVGFSECARTHLAAKPIKGDAILFHSIKPSGELEKKSLHTACPVIKGEKWSTAKWIHVGPYAMNGERPQRVDQVINNIYTNPADSGPGCRDMDEMCPSWAASGECSSNPTYMVGDRARPGQCVKSCGACALVMSSGAESSSNTPSAARKFGEFRRGMF